MKTLKYAGTHYQWFGPENNETPVIVLIHGLGLNRHMWQWQVPVLAERYRVLTYDLIGHGDSAKPDKFLNLKTFSEQLYELLAHEKIQRACVVGFSLGGMIARRFAMDHAPECASLVIMNSTHRRSSEAQAAIDKRVTQTATAGPASTVEAALVRWFTPEFNEANPDIMNLVRRWVLANDPEVYPRCYEVLASGVDELLAPKPPIECPTLVMTADEDSGSPAAMAEAIASEIAGSQTHILTGLRHMALAEAPDLVNAAILTFLESIEHE